MFAPPPATCLPTGEARARLEAAKETIRQSKIDESDISRNSSPRSPSERGSSPLSRVDSRDSKQSRARSKFIFSKSNKSRDIQIGSPVLLHTSNPSTPGTPKQDARSQPSSPSSNAAGGFQLPERSRLGVGLPPKRPPRPDESHLPPVSRPVWLSDMKPPLRSPPAVPMVSVAGDAKIVQPTPLPPPKHEPVFSEAALHKALHELQTTSPRSPLPLTPIGPKLNGGGGSPQLTRSSTAPPRARRNVTSIRTSRPPRRASTAQASEVLEQSTVENDSGEVSPGEGETRNLCPGEPDAGKKSPEVGPVRDRRRRQLQTAAMAQTISSLFASGSASTDTLSTSTSSSDFQPSPLNFIDKDLPDTPPGVLDTPSEVEITPFGRVQVINKRHRRRISNVKVPSLTPMNTELECVDEDAAEHYTLSRLSDIPEPVVNEITPPASGISTPKATSIRLRGGSVLTIAPPECSAWTRQVYAHGPIKLLKPAILPRRNTVASLDPFQEALDAISSDIYRQRRCSDDKTVDDICDWYAQFEFDEIGYDGDKLLRENLQCDDADTLDELLATPPLVPIPEDATGNEGERASESTELLSLSNMIPPDTEEALRARGIARRTRPKDKGHSRVDSHTLASNDLAAAPDPKPVVVVRPTPHTSSEANIAFRSDSGFDWDDDDENDSDAAQWASSGWNRMNELNQRQAQKPTKNPVAKMSRLMATARTIL